MHPAFASIQYGPFATAYHQGSINEAFREALSDFLERCVLPQVVEPFCSTEGRLTAIVNEQKYCGPTSLIRDIYKLEFAFIREGSTDRLRDEFRFDGKTGTFVRRWEQRPVILWTKERRARERAHRPAVEKMLARILSNKPGKYQCPRCDAALCVTRNGQTVELACPEGCFTAKGRRIRGRPKVMAGYHSYPRRPTTRSHPEMGDDLTRD